MVHAASQASPSMLPQTLQCLSVDQVFAGQAPQAAAALEGAHAGRDWACGAADCVLPLGSCGAVRRV